MAYVGVKLCTSLVLGAIAIAAVYVVGRLTHQPAMPAATWVETGAIAWLGSLLFAALGLFIGHLLPSENVMQVIGFLIML